MRTRRGVTLEALRPLPVRGLLSRGRAFRVGAVDPRWPSSVLVRSVPWTMIAEPMVPWVVNDDRTLCSAEGDSGDALAASASFATTARPGVALISSSTSTLAHDWSRFGPYRG